MLVTYLGFFIIIILSIVHWLDAVDLAGLFLILSTLGNERKNSIFKFLIFILMI